MKIYQLLIFVILFYAIPQFADSQNLKENELVIIQGEKFILHQVRTGETVYSISRDFKIESTQLQKYNPNISEGLSIGDILKIPFNENVKLSEIPDFQKGDPTGFTSYTIQSNNETAYSIAKTYGITVEEIYTYNPNVQRFKKGLVLKIPQWNFLAKTEAAKVAPDQQQVGNQIKNNNDLIEHTVVSGETLFSIGKRYQVTESEIIQYNPEAKNLKAGSKLYLPKKPIQSSSGEPTSAGNIQSKYVNHTIVSGETLFGITQKYRVSETELKSLNPELNNAFRAGTVIRIPLKENTSDPVKAGNEVAIVAQDKQESVPGIESTGKISVDCVTRNSQAASKTYVVALFLPLYLDANEELNSEIVAEKTDTLNQTEGLELIAADTIIETENPVQLTRQFYGNSENFLQFYEGVLIAVDSMQKAGMKIELNVFDTKDNPETVRKVINRDDFTRTDLIIGPVYENVQKEVAQIAVKNKIPIISPFTPKSAIIGSNPQFYQINPTREYLAETTVNFIAAEFSETNFIVVGTSSYVGTPEGQMVEFIRKKLDNQGKSGGGRYTEYDFRKERSRGLKNILLPDKENVVFIPSSDEGELSVAISNINNLADEYSITLIGTSNYQQKYPSIEVAHYHNLKLKYINPYWIDYQKNTTINYIGKFISNFGTEPNSYGIQGFDAAWYFLNALNLYGKDFNSCLPYLKIDLLQGNYYFKKVSPAGGYMNQGVSVVSYNRNFEVERQSVIGNPNFERAD